MDARRRACLDAMGLPAWSRRPDRILPGAPVPAVAAHAASEAVLPAAPAHSAPGDLDWDALEARVSTCTACALHAGRTRTVFGVGARNADWLIIGEAPGAEEDRQGEPFVGRAGKLLDAMLAALGQSREQAYIANTVKCRPPQNRNPQAEETECCAPFLDRQIELLAPRVILAVGAVAARRLLATDAPVGRLRGQIHRYGPAEIPLVVTWHPAYLLRKPEAKAGAWQDLVLAAGAAGAADGSRPW